MASSSSLPSTLPWQWILQHLLDIKDIGTPILKEIMTYIPGVEENRDLQKRIALRYLEEILAAGKIDAQAIPLMATLTKDSLTTEAKHNPALATSLSSSGLLLRLQIEAILACIRKEPRNWQGFDLALDHYLPEESEDVRIAERRKHLQTLRQSQNREKRCSKILETYSVDALHDDLYNYVTSKKSHVEQTFLCQLLHDVLKGQYPLSEALVMNPLQKEDSQTDAHVKDVQTNSVGSDDPTVFCNRSLDEADCDSVKEQHRASFRNEWGVGMQLRERDQDGKAVTSQSPLKSMLNHSEGFPAKCTSNKRIETTAKDIDKGSVGEGFTNLESDGNEEVCYKCRKGGNLLCCDGCPVVVHEKCLGSRSSILIEQGWFCPICMQKQAAEALAMAQQKERDAREKLADFMKGLGGRTSKERSGRVSTHLFVQPESVFRKSNGMDCAMPAVKTDSAKQAPPEISISDVKDAAHSADYELSKGIEMTKPDNQQKENSNQNLSVPDGADMPTSNANELFSKEGEHVDTNQAHIQDEDGDGHDGDLEEGSEDKNADGLSIGRQNSRRKRSHIWRLKDRSHAIRRKRVLWTKEEEGILKEGVKKYSHDNGSWGFQWSRILEFGKAKFHPSRTSVDLKDKWRNLARSYM